jgi:hypothetical protein
MKSIEVSLDKCTPAIESVLQAQGIPGLLDADNRIIKIAEEALSIYGNLAEPAGILKNISKENFSEVFFGEGNNLSEAPLENIYMQADNLSLFAVTIGQGVCDNISELFKNNDFPLGSMIDSVASEGADLAAKAMEDFYCEHISNMKDNFCTMRFSPGYCGWHVSAQNKLFNYLKPERIGITLNDSCLTTPLKSVSGVIVYGQKHIFQFDDTFEFCAECADHSCQDRIQEIMKSDRG